MGGRSTDTGLAFPKAEVGGIALTKTRDSDSAAWDFFERHCAAEGITIREAGSGTIAAAMTAYALSERQAGLVEAAGIAQEIGRNPDWQSPIARETVRCAAEEIAEAILAAAGRS